MRDRLHFLSISSSANSAFLEAKRRSSAMRASFSRGKSSRRAHFSRTTAPISGPEPLVLVRKARYIRAIRRPGLGIGVEDLRVMALEIDRRRGRPTGAIRPLSRQRARQGLRRRDQTIRRRIIEHHGFVVGAQFIGVLSHNRLPGTQGHSGQREKRRRNRRPPGRPDPTPRPAAHATRRAHISS